MNKRPILLAVITALLMVPLVQGCMDPANDPLAAASAVAKLGDVSAVSDVAGFQTMASTVANELTAEELASLVNVGLGQDWTLDDANAVKDLLGQIDQEKAEALENSGIDDQNATDEEVKQALEDAGLEVTDQQIDLLRELFNAVS